jgi:predicted amidohydrolase
MTVVVAVSQFASGLDKRENLARVCRAITDAAGAGAALVVTPEYGMYCDLRRVGPSEGYAEPVDGPFLTAVRDTVRAAGVTAVVGMFESVPGQVRAANTVAAVGPDGGLLGLYRKLHLYDAFGFAESDTVLPGDLADPLTFDLGGLRFGAMTCYDLRFPETARRLVDAGATALVLPAAWAAGPAKEDHWTTLVRARAIENTGFVLAAAQSGPDCAGQSMVVDPMGVVLACAGERPGMALAALDPARLDQVRAVNPCLVNRRFRVVPAGPVPDADGRADDS